MKSLEFFSGAFKKILGKVGRMNRPCVRECRLHQIHRTTVLQHCFGVIVQRERLRGFLEFDAHYEALLGRAERAKQGGCVLSASSTARVSSHCSPPTFCTEF